MEEPFIGRSETGDLSNISFQAIVVVLLAQQQREFFRIALQRTNSLPFIRYQYFVTKTTNVMLSQLQRIVFMFQQLLNNCNPFGMTTKFDLNFITLSKEVKILPRIIHLLLFSFINDRLKDRDMRQGSECDFSSII